MSDEPASTPLTPTQKRVVGFSLTLLAVLGSVALIVGALIVVVRPVDDAASVLWPLAVPVVLTLILRGVVEVLIRRFRIRRLTAIVFLYGMVILVLSALLLAVLPPV